ncbi:MAG: 6,7-dimethyl-8-ribityllumazine synthase, partial [Betaproteobacteria bacterium]|nr:6,7-dimethyl-8-ribityllumazine synthase [Betaproteobacteria bacterium]
MHEEKRVEAEVFEAIVDGAGMRVGIVQARFNAPVCEQLRQSCLDALGAMGVSIDDVVVMTVPGALEIPGVLSKLAQTMQFDALIAIGAVIRGETYHFEVVSNESAAGIRQLGDAKIHDLRTGAAFGQQDVVDAPHRGKGTDAAGEAAGQFLHLADLALVLGHIGVADAERRGGVVLVHILAAREDAQLSRAAVSVRRPRRHPRLDRGPVGHDQRLTGRGQQRRAQHPLENVGDALAELRNDLVPAHHR